jgi:hypothetical protein
MLVLADQEFKTAMFKVLRTLMRKVDRRQGHMSNVSKWMKRIHNTKYKTAEVNPIISIVTLKVYGVSNLIEKQCSLDELKIKVQLCAVYWK